MTRLWGSVTDLVALVSDRDKQRLLGKAGLSNKGLHSLAGLMRFASMMYLIAGLVLLLLVLLLLVHGYNNRSEARLATSRSRQSEAQRRSAAAQYLKEAVASGHITKLQLSIQQADEVGGLGEHLLKKARQMLEQKLRRVRTANTDNARQNTSAKKELKSPAKTTQSKRVGGAKANSSTTKSAPSSKVSSESSLEASRVAAESDSGNKANASQEGGRSMLPSKRSSDSSGSQSASPKVAPVEAARQLPHRKSSASDEEASSAAQSKGDTGGGAAMGAGATCKPGKPEGSSQSTPGTAAPPDPTVTSDSAAFEAPTVPSASQVKRRAYKPLQNGVAMLGDSARGSPSPVFDQPPFHDTPLPRDATSSPLETQVSDQEVISAAPGPELKEKEKYPVKAPETPAKEPVPTNTKSIASKPAPTNNAVSLGSKPLQKKQQQPTKPIAPDTLSLTGNSFTSTLGNSFTSTLGNSFTSTLGNSFTSTLGGASIPDPSSPKASLFNPLISNPLTGASSYLGMTASAPSAQDGSVPPPNLLSMDTVTDQIMSLSPGKMQSLVALGSASEETYGFPAVPSVPVSGTYTLGSLYNSTGMMQLPPDGQLGLSSLDRLRMTVAQLKQLQAMSAAAVVDGGFAANDWVGSQLLDIGADVASTPVGGPIGSLGPVEAEAQGLGLPPGGDAVQPFPGMNSKRSTNEQRSQGVPGTGAVSSGGQGQTFYEPFSSSFEGIWGTGPGSFFSWNAEAAPSSWQMEVNSSELHQALPVTLSREEQYLLPQILPDADD